MSAIILTSPLPLDQNPAAVYVASLAHTGRRTQAQALRVVADIMGSDINSLNWGALRYQHTAMIRSQIASRYKPSTANKILVALRQALKHAWLLGQMSLDDYMKASKMKPITGETLPAGRYLTALEIKAMIDVCKADKNQSAGVRDAAMIALMYTALMRREEIANASLDDYNPATAELIVFGKRDKERNNYLENGAKAALESWLSIRGNAPGALFVAVDKSGKIAEYDHITPTAVNNMVAKRSKQAGVENNSPHNFRRTGASDYLAADVDVITVSKLGGWDDLKTLRRYDRRPDEAKKKAAAKLYIPF